jgi:hypothetical protein
MAAHCNDCGWEAQASQIPFDKFMTRRDPRLVGVKEGQSVNEGKWNGPPLLRKREDGVRGFRAVRIPALESPYVDCDRGRIP